MEKSSDLKDEVIRKKHVEMLKLHTSDFDIVEGDPETGVANLTWLV